MASLMCLLLVGSLGSISLKNLELRGKLSKFLSKCLSFISTIACQELGYTWN